MEFLKSQYDRVSQQLAGLTPSQKMLSAALVVIMAMTLLWFGKYAGNPEMVPLLDQPIAQEDLGRIQSRLRAMGVPFEAQSDGKLLVPAEKQYTAIADLSLASALPRNTSAGFESMMKSLSPFDNPDRQGAVFNRGKEMALERVISEYPGVVTASVFIDAKFKRDIGRGDVNPTATVNVQTRDGEGGGKSMALACANLVSGAQAGLGLHNVKVLINGKVYPMRDPNDVGAGGLDGSTAIELQQLHEANITRNIERALGYIDGVRISVAVRVNNASEATRTEAFDKDKSFVTEQEIQTKTLEQTNTPPPAGEAGVIANVTGPVTAGSAPQAAGQSVTETQETIKNAVNAGKTTTERKTPAGEATAIGASVRVPRSYFVLAAKGGDPSAKDPDAATLEKIMTEEMNRIRKDVQVCTAIKSADGITVEPYADIIPAAAHTPQTAGAANFSGVLTGHVKEIALGGLALASLFMMSMIVRKSAPAPVVAATTPAPSAPTGPMRLESAEILAGEVAGGSPSMDGVEMDEGSIRAQQVFTQVSEMVGANPEAAASLIKRWMNQR